MSSGTYRNGCASVGWLVVEPRKPPRAVQGFRGTEGGPYPRMLDTGCALAAEGRMSSTLFRRGSLETLAPPLLRKHYRATPRTSAEIQRHQHGMIARGRDRRHDRPVATAANRTCTTRREDLLPQS